MTANGRSPGTALVTGASGRIGEAVVERLAYDGWNIFASSLSGGHGRIAADLRDPAAADALVARVVGDAGRLDVVVHGGAWIRLGRVDEQDPDEWWGVVDSQLSAAFHLVRPAIPHLEASGGRVVLMSCEWGVSGRAGATAVSAAAGGIIGLTKAMAREYGPRIRVNCVAPGELEGVRVDQSDYPGVPLASIARPTAPMVAAAVAFLAGRDGAAFNGQVLHPNGGATLA